MPPSLPHSAQTYAHGREIRLPEIMQSASESFNTVDIAVGFDDVDSRASSSVANEEKVCWRVAMRDNGVLLVFIQIGPLCRVRQKSRRTKKWTLCQVMRIITMFVCCFQAVPSSQTKHSVPLFTVSEISPNDVTYHSSPLIGIYSHFMTLQSGLHES